MLIGQVVTLCRAAWLADAVLLLPVLPLQRPEGLLNVLICSPVACTAAESCFAAWV